MAGVLLALAAAGSWGTADYLGGLQAKRLPALTVALVSQTAGLVVLTSVLLVAGSWPADYEVLLIGAAAGVSAAIGVTALYKGLAVGPMSVVAPVSAMSGAVGVVVGLTRGDRPAGLQLGGIVLALVGVALASRAQQDRKTAVSPQALWLAALAALGIGVFVVLVDAGGRRDPIWTIASARVATVAVLLIPVAATRNTPRITSAQFGSLATIGSLDAGAGLLVALAAATGSLLAVIAAIVALYPAVTVVLARSLLHERLSPVQQIGVGSVIAIAVG